MPQTGTTPCKCIRKYATIKICISRPIMGLRWFDPWKILKKHFISQNMLISCKGFWFWYEIGPHWEFLFRIIGCSSDQLPKSVRATILQLGVDGNARYSVTWTKWKRCLLFCICSHVLAQNCIKILSQMIYYVYIYTMAPFFDASLWTTPDMLKSHTVQRFVVNHTWYDKIS